jgi:lipoprotein-anchoring transpeptidase ErfK/SrfK
LATAPHYLPGQWQQIAERVMFSLRVYCITCIILTGMVFAAPITIAAEKKFVAEPRKSETEKIIRLQIFLDEQDFGPGIIDGRIGQFTRKAVAHYNYIAGLKYNNFSKVLSEASRRIKKIYTTYIVSEGDFKFVGEVPSEPEDQAQVDYLSYRSIHEFVAERYHTDNAFLKKINPSINWDKVAAGTRIRVPNVTPFVIEDLAVNKSYTRDKKLSKRLIIVDTAQKLAVIWEKNKLIATFPITPGEEKFVHRGKWKIWNMITTPVFRWDQSMLDTGKRSDESFKLPPGPNSPIGILWAGISKPGIGLHGTASPETIGRSRSAGCIRLANWNVIRLPALIRPGATVEIR